MAKDNKIYVLDTSAIFCLKDNEIGADKVEEILELANKGKTRVLLSFMTLMEYLYINLMRFGEDVAHKFYLQLTLLPVSIIESDEDLRVTAAGLKSNYNISMADSWIAATAVNNDAILVHRDSEFDELKDIVRCINLPYK